MSNIKKLPSDLINQIAAGEVIERPASVIKELVDNSIDAGSTSIKITVKNGGISLMEVSDNGIGISKENLPLAFERHTTSKIASFDDLNRLLTMGFRGEALSTISSVAQVDVVSRSRDGKDAYELKPSIDNTDKEVKEAARDVGTTIRVEDIFNNVPARKKFLKTAQTEYRRVLETLLPYFLIYPNIHFTLVKDSKTVFNLPPTDTDGKNTFTEERLKEVLKSDFTTNPIPLFYDGDGMKITGFLSHPKYHKKRVSEQFLYVNGRSITDRGLYRAVHEGYGTFIPKGEKVPFVLALEIRPDLVDVNVHPRKEEVRFANPYRVFSAVENAVEAAIQKFTKENDVSEYTPISGSGNEDGSNAFNRLRDVSNIINAVPQSYTPQNKTYGRSSVQGSYSKPSKTETPPFMDMFTSSVKDSGADTYTSTNEADVIEGIGGVRQAFQVFNKYLIVELSNQQLWIIDQHAAAERISFERLINNHDDVSGDIQELLVPVPLKLTDTEREYVAENSEFFTKIGFTLETKDDLILVKSVPAEFRDSAVTHIFDSIFSELTDDDRDLSKDYEEARNEILATVACHSSIRSQQSLQPAECVSLMKQLLDCDNPYSCPHGRPIVWKMGIDEIDKNFDRTY